MQLMLLSFVPAVHVGTIIKQDGSFFIEKQTFVCI